MLQQRYPEVDVDADAIYVRDGAVDLGGRDGGHRSGAGGGRGRLRPRAGALEVARDLVMYLKRPGEEIPQFSVRLASQSTTPQHSEHAAMDLAAPGRAAVDGADGRAGGDERSAFSALVFTGVRADARLDARLERAKQLLEENLGLPLKTIAARAGLGSEQALRHLFSRQLGITPLNPIVTLWKPGSGEGVNERVSG